MSRKLVNAAVDAAALVAFTMLVATGLLLRYTLPPGSGGRVGLGRGGGRGAGREIALVLGRTRHEWGEVHFWISVAFLLVLATHVALHWRWILAVLRGAPRSPESAGIAVRVIVGVLAAAALLVVVLLPLVVEPERVPRSALRGEEPP